MDLLKCDVHHRTQAFLEMLYDSKITPTITKPTRITTSSTTLIDNILVNVELSGNVSSGIIEEHISDHLPCYNLISGIRVKKWPTLEVTSRDIRPKNIRALKRRLESDPQLLLPQHENCVDSQFDEFHKKLLDEIDHFLPERTRNINPRSIRREPWVSQGLLISIKQCKRLYRKHLKNRSNEQVHTKYKRYNAELKRTKRAAMKHHYNSKCTEHRDNTKKLWHTINQVIKKTNNKTDVIEALKIDNVQITDGSLIVNEFGKYYSNVGKNLAQGMPKPRRTVESYLNEVKSNQNSIFLNLVTNLEVCKIIGKLLPKHSSGLDNINNKILKEIGDLISDPLTIIFNNSLCKGVFPGAMKMAKVVPLYNKEASWLYAELCAHKMWSLRCHGSHVFPIFLEMSGKSSLPCLCLRCHGSHVFPVFPEMLGKTFGDVGEDNWRCWGRQEHWERHSRLSRRTSRRMGMTLGRSGMMGKTSGMTGKTLGRSGKMRKTSRVFPVFASRCHGSHVFPIFLEMSGKSSLPCLCLRCWGRHVFRVSPEMLEKTLGDVGEDIREDGDDMSSLSSLRCQGRHVFSIFLEMSGKSSLPCLCLRCWGRHVFRVSPEMLEKTLGDVGEDIKEDGYDIGEVREAGEDIGDDGDDIGDDRDDIGEVREPA